MKLRSIIWIPLALLLAGCGGKKPEPVAIGQTAAFTADGVSENPFTGKKTEVHMDADLTVDAVMQVRNTSVDDQASLLLVLARIKNNSKEPLSLRGRDCTLHTKSGKVYQGNSPFPGDEGDFPLGLTGGKTISQDLKELVSPSGSKPARGERFKTGRSEVRNSYHFWFFEPRSFAAS